MSGAYGHGELAGAAKAALPAAREKIDSGGAYPVQSAAQRLAASGVTASSSAAVKAATLRAFAQGHNAALDHVLMLATGAVKRHVWSPTSLTALEPELVKIARGSTAIPPSSGGSAAHHAADAELWHKVEEADAATTQLEETLEGLKGVLAQAGATAAGHEGVGPLQTLFGMKGGPPAFPTIAEVGTAATRPPLAPAGQPALRKVVFGDANDYAKLIVASVTGL